MSRQCPACSKTNPANAHYCYYDGRALSNSRHHGPLQLGSMAFAMPFCFSDGQSCANFNQLTLACDERWDEARNLLADGVWPAFFGSIGRLDLAAAAKQAAKEPDRDVGFCQLLEKFPADADALRPPKLVLPFSEKDLGQLTPGTDQTFDLMITNQGMLILRGMVSTDCDWLVFGDRRGPSHKMFQTRSICTIPVRVLGSKLHAGLRPLYGEIVVDTNGGAITVPVRGNVPVRPFPKGAHANDALAGARSPHEIALKAKAHLNEAAILFEQGAVRAWYASNGWTYPIEGSEGSGKGAVQQFFEALGLTKPPHLEINTGPLMLKGKVGQRLLKRVTISTKEAKPVYAQAWSNQNWVTLGPSKSQGNKITIPLEIVVPPRPGETVQAGVTFQGNGKQRFDVPVSLQVVESHVVTDDDAEPDDEPPSRRSLGWIFAGVGLLLAIAAGVVFVVMNGQREEPGPGPIVHVPDFIAPPAPMKVEAWWDDLDTTIPAAVVALKRGAPQDEALFDGIATKSDLHRFEAYEKLLKKLPDLMRDPKAKDPLGPLITECYAFEPIEANAAVLRRWLMNQVPREGAAFRPEDKGDDLERSFWSLQVDIGALTHRKIRRERARKLAQDLGLVLGSPIDASAPPREITAQVEKLLAVRCYLNTLPTAAKSVDHALWVRDVLIKRVPDQLAPDFREAVDVDLIAVGLSTGNEAWPKLEPILQTCLDSSELAITLKVVDLYENADRGLAPQVEAVLAAKWKVAADKKLKQADKVAAIRNELVGGKVVGTTGKPADRQAQLQKLTSSALSGAKAAPNQGLAVLQDAVRLAHASTMACALAQKGTALARFDALIANIPEIDPTDHANASAKGDNPKQPAGNAGLMVGVPPKIVKGVLNAAFERDPDREGCYRRVHLFSLKVGQLYTMEFNNNALDASLRLEDANGIRLAEDEDSGGTRNARIVFAPQAGGTYKVITCGAGNYTLQVRQGVGGGGFGLPGGGFPGIGPVKKEQPGKMPGQAKPNTKGTKSKLDNSDFTKLANGNPTKVRLAAFNRIAENLPDDLPPSHAQPLARYVLSLSQKSEEIDAVTAKLGSFAKCRNLLLALADHARGSEVSQKTAETVVGGVLGQALRFTNNEDYRLACQKLLLQQAVDLIAAKNSGAEEAADILRDLYAEQGLAFGMDAPELAALTRPSQVLQAVVQHVASQPREIPAQEDKEYLEQIGRHLKVAEYVAENDLEHLVLLQRIWLKVLTIHLQQQAPDQKESMMQFQQQLAEHDRRSSGVLDQLRAGEEKTLRVWKLAHHLK